MNEVEIRKMIGKRIAIARKAAGLEQSQLGEIIGAHEQTVSRWERGIRSPSVEYLLAITKACSCTADFLLGESDTLEIRQN